MLSKAKHLKQFLETLRYTQSDVYNYRSFVMLSKAKHLKQFLEALRYAQSDSGGWTLIPPASA